MAFEELKNQADQVQEETRAYVDSTLAYYKLWGFKVAMRYTSLAIKAVLIALCVIMILLFASVAAALAIGSAVNSHAFGFLIVGGIYLILLVLILLARDKITEGPILRRFSEIYFNE